MSDAVSAALTRTDITLIKGGLVMRHAHAAATHQDILVRHGRIEQLCPKRGTMSLTPQTGC